jgi:hypothetical protein
MAKIKINNLHRANQMVDLDDKQLFNVLGGLESWHIYHAPDGTVIDREWENDGQNTVVHHYPFVFRF